MASSITSTSVDGSWNLTITVTDLQLERTLRVTGSVHIGGVMVQLVEALGNIIYCITLMQFKFVISMTH